MPTNQRVRSAIIDVSEGLADIGYEVIDLVGPISEGKEISEEELEGEESGVQYYLTGQARHAHFYIVFELDKRYAVIVYPMNVLRHLGSYLDRDEMGELLDRSVDWEDLDDQQEDSVARDAAEQVVENTEPIQYHRAAFNLSAYASTSLVDYRQMTTENGFPTEFQCARGLFPYTEHMTIKRLNDRVQPVIIAGERGRRYIEYSFHIDKEEKSPDEYEFAALI